MSEVERGRNLERWLRPESRSRRLLLGLAIYVACLVVFAIMAGDRLATHTNYNHYALLADAWLHGRHHLLGTPPSYAGMNDFALFDSKWFISFPPFPAVLMLPLVAVAGSPENFRDGQFVVWLAGIGPAVLFLALEKLRRTGRSERSEVENIRLALLFAFGTVYFFTAVQGTVWFAAHVVGVGLAGIGPAVLFLVLEKLRRTGRSERSEVENVRLALLFAFGTVYFFTAVQGTVWFAAHVVGVGLAALFVLFALDAERPALAGAMIGCMFLTRTTTLLVGSFFVFEAVRVAYGRPLPAASEGTFEDRVRLVVRDLDRAALVRSCVRFAVPVLAAFAFASWLNASRFHDPAPWAFGHEYLQVGWKTRIDRWGLFSVHFLPRNLSVMLASLPWKPTPAEPRVILDLLGLRLAVPHWIISGHGLALWFTTPVYLWLARPKKVDFLWSAAAIAAAGPCLMNLLYQNSGWFQFGYRFSNDYAVFLFVLLAISTPRLSRAFWVLAAWGVLVNTFGAASFERPKYDAFYSHEAAAPLHRSGGPATLDLVFPPD